MGSGADLEEPQRVCIARVQETPEAPLLKPVSPFQLQQSRQSCVSVPGEGGWEESGEESLGPCPALQ